MLLKKLKANFCSSKLLFSLKMVASKPNPQQKRNLLIVHGFLGNGFLYRHLVQNYFIRQNFNSYLIDLPNHGNSYHTPEVSMFQMGQALAKWIKYQQFEKDVTLVGHSLGGRTIYAMTKLHPELQEIVKKIVIVDAAPHSYLNYNFHLDTQKLLENLLTVDLNSPRQNIESQLKAISPNNIWYETLLSSIDTRNSKWYFNLVELEKKYRNFIGFGIEEADWKGKVVVLKALKSEFVNEKSVELLKRIYPDVEIVDVDCGHHIQVESPFSILNVVIDKV